MKKIIAQNSKYKIEKENNSLYVNGLRAHYNSKIKVLLSQKVNGIIFCYDKKNKKEHKIGVSDSLYPKLNIKKEIKKSEGVHEPCTICGTYCCGDCQC